MIALALALAGEAFESLGGGEQIGVCTAPPAAAATRGILPTSGAAAWVDALYRPVQHRIRGMRAACLPTESACDPFPDTPLLLVRAAHNDDTDVFVCRRCRQ
jgi:hypothetical protein